METMQVSYTQQDTMNFGEKYMMIMSPSPSYNIQVTHI